MFPLANKNLLLQQRVKKAKPIHLHTFPCLLFEKQRKATNTMQHSDGRVANNISQQNELANVSKSFCSTK